LSLVSFGRKMVGMRIQGRFCDRKLAPKTDFDPRSFRWKKIKAGFVLVACPAGDWNPRGRYKGKRGRCAVGTRAHHILVRSAPGKKCCPRARAGERCVVKRQRAA